MDNQNTYQIKILNSAFDIYGGFENLYPLWVNDYIFDNKDIDTFFDNLQEGKRYTTFEINTLTDCSIMDMVLDEIFQALLNVDDFEPYPTVSSWNRLIKQTAENLKEYEKELKEIRESIRNGYWNNIL